MIIGTPKSLEEFQTFSAIELDALFKGIEQLATSGTPLEVPGSLPIGQLARISVTLKRFHGVLQDMDAVGNVIEAREGPDPVRDQEMLLGAIKRARALIHIGAPKEQRVVAPPTGRLILPS